MKILLVEPGYKNKYPPLGLMKISAYHKKKNDEVTFVKGLNKEIKEQVWDRIYISTLFTFYWKKTIDTIKYYYNSVCNKSNIYVGGVLATLLENDLRSELDIQGINIISGLLNKPGILGNDDIIIDTITPDYDIVDNVKNKYLDYTYEVQNSYISYTTRGCIRKCKFCAVKTLEPNYCAYIDIKEQIRIIDDKYGVKRNLMLLDNNILASSYLDIIVDDLVKLGFGRGNKSYINKTNNRTLKQTRYIDFNQGIDARLLSEDLMKQLARIEIKPLRIAFDHADEESINIYVRAQRLAARYEMHNLSNYILFNYEDRPEDLYKRLKINIELNNEFSLEGFKTSIWSFPMKYMPIKGDNSKARKYIGEHWNPKLLRGVQCILNATHGIVGPKEGFFKHAFGATYEEFISILYMPEYYITKRKVNTENGNIEHWKNLYIGLNSDEKVEFINLIKDNKFPDVKIDSIKIRKLYDCYLNK